MNFLYFDLSCEITIGNVVVNHVHSVTIDESIKTLSDTATIVLPREYTQAIVKNKLNSFEKKNILDFINVDDVVKIKLGYNDDLEAEFEGFVTKISADIPLVIQCEDAMWKLRKSNYTKTFLNVTLKELLRFIASNYKHDIIADVSLGKFSINNESAYQVLERLRKDYGLHARFVKEVLQIGFPVDFKPQKEHQINMNRNVRAEQSDLEYVRQRDFKILLKAFSINKSGERISHQFGDAGGVIRSLHFTGKTMFELKELTEKNYKSLSFDGYRGSIPTWGLPRTKAGETSAITDPNYEHSDRGGNYLIEGVRKEFNGTVGFKRINKLGLKL